MKRRWIGRIIGATTLWGATILVIAGCSTLGSSGGSGGPRPQQLSEEEKGRIARYGELREGILVDELRTRQQDEQTFEFTNERMTYEGVLLLRYLGLQNVLSEEEAEQFIKAVFKYIPQENPNGAPIRNIVVPRWYKNGMPLILHISTAYVQNKTKKYPAIVVLMNTSDIVIDQFGYQIGREITPQYQYPRFVRKNQDMYLEADGTYVFVVQGNGLVSASTRMSDTIPPIEASMPPRTKLNLTDSYLRDENPKNDSIVLPILKEIYEGEKTAPSDRLHAGLQLFLFYFFHQETDKAEAMAEELQASPLLNDGGPRREISSIIKKDLPLIIMINRRLYR